MLLHEHLELPDELPVQASSEVALDPVLEACDVQLLETRDLRVCEALVREVGERRASPECESLVETLFTEEPLETCEIELVGFHTNEVARRLGDQTLPAEHLPELGYVDLEGLLGRVRRLFLPQRLHQPILGDDPVRVQEKHRQQRALFLPAQLEHLATGRDLERTEDAKVHLRCLSDDASTARESPQASAFAVPLPGGSRLFAAPRSSGARDRTPAIRTRRKRCTARLTRFDRLSPRSRWQRPSRLSPFRLLRPGTPSSTTTSATRSRRTPSSTTTSATRSRRTPSSTTTSATLPRPPSRSPRCRS